MIAIRIWRRKNCFVLHNTPACRVGHGVIAGWRRYTLIQMFTPALAMKMPRPKTLLLISACTAVLTIILKMGAWYVTGSVGLLSDGLESFVNLAGAVFALLMVTIAERPADADHPHGHHKAEYFAAGFEGMLIFGAALGILWTSVDRLLHPAELERLDWGMAFSVASTVLNGVGAWVPRQLHRNGWLRLPPVEVWIGHIAKPIDSPSSLLC